ncbi:putative LRR receptor-like serine/threonine-protein kinase [Vitis vinifera]|uniref:Putative LRR receptor-like serine/threonine-protein kinase n=1 Tax=Vitis vinifera TaxID=29760 RepID=A0A438H8M0_VITVI|nr:putative LRR receptor-like serine/threonine-protein kinase [Vitis vinifera]
MTTIDLSGNHLNGSIQESFSDLPRLQKLLLENNLLSGSVPTGIWQNRSLSTSARLTVDLQNNSFSNITGDLNPPANVTLCQGKNVMDGGYLSILGPLFPLVVIRSNGWKFTL